MREIYSFDQPQFPEFLEVYMPKCKRFVLQMKDKFINPSEDQLDKFARHLLNSFYLLHGEVSRLDGDLESLLNENKGRH
jgi:hypothetical protein